MIPIFQNTFFELGILRHFLKGVCFFNCKSLYLKDHDSYCCYQSSIYEIMIIISMKIKRSFFRDVYILYLFELYIIILRVCLVSELVRDAIFLIFKLQLSRGHSFGYKLYIYFYNIPRYIYIYTAIYIIFIANDIYMVFK